MFSKKKRLVIFLLLVCVLALGLRFVHISADPLPISFLDTQDEGLHSYAARTFYLTGKWHTDNFFFGLITPVFPPLQLIGLYLFGLHNYAFRFISIVASIATIVLLFKFLKKHTHILTAQIAVMSLSVNFYFLVYGRSGLPEATMLFFSLASFIIWFETLVSKRYHFVYAFFTGLFLTLAFFTKETSVSLFGVVFSSFLLFLGIDRERKKYIFICLGVLSGVLVIAALYWIFIVLPNRSLWEFNLLAININRTPMRMFLFIPFTIGEIKKYLFGEQWRYLPIQAVGTIVLFIFFIKTLMQRGIRKLRNNKILILACLVLLWVIFFSIHVILMPAKWGRFLISFTIPMTIAFSMLFYFNHKKTVRYLLYALLLLDIVYNLSLGYYFILRKPQYVYLDATKQLQQIIKKNDLANLPSHWIMNGNFKTVNTFLIAQNDTGFYAFYHMYGWPKYIAFSRSQVTRYKADSPLLFSRLRFIKKVYDYDLFQLQ